jgi:lysozyme family protein
VQWTKITIIVCDKDLDGKITAKDLNRVTLEDAKVIYKINYWDVALGDEIGNQAVAEMIVDFFINSGAWSKYKTYTKIAKRYTRWAFWPGNHKSN